MYLYSDGGCYPNPGGPMGWAFIIKDGEEIERGWGSAVNGTNNRAELMGVIDGLKRIAPNTNVIIVSDSQYITKGIAEWRHNWKKYGFEGVKNSDLWIELDHLLSRVNARTEWVKGHNNHPENEECDRMATEAYRVKPLKEI